MGLDFDGLAAVAVRRGRHADAARLIGGVDALRHRAGYAVPAADQPERDRLEAAARAALGAEYDLRYAEGARMRPDALARLGAGGSGAPDAQRWAVVGHPSHAR
jgi:hypothetical protein